MGEINVQKLTYTTTPEEVKIIEDETKKENDGTKAVPLSYVKADDETEFVTLSLDEDDDLVEETDTKDEDVPQTTALESQADEEKKQEFTEVSVVAWGSTPEDGKKYANDCLSRIMVNTYPDIEMYSDEWNKLEEEIMNLNPEIYGKMNDDGTISDGRKRLIDDTRHNSVLYTGDVIKLPVIEQAQAQADETPIEEEHLADTKDADAADETTPDETAMEESGAEEASADETGAKTETITHDDGTYTTTTTTPEGDKYGVTSESIEYDAEGKAISGTAEYNNGVRANVAFKYNDDNSYDKIYTPTEDTASMTDTALYCQQFDSTGALIKEIWEINDTTDGGKIYSQRVKIDENTYETTIIDDNKKAVIESALDENNRESVRVEKFYDEDGNPESGKMTNFEYNEKGEESKIVTQFFDKTGNNWATTTTEYNDDRSYTKTSVFPESDGITWQFETFEADNTIKEGKYIRKGTTETGEIRGVILYNADGGKTITEYAMRTGDIVVIEIDKNGNEIKREYIEGEEPKYI